MIEHDPLRPSEEVPEYEGMRWYGTYAAAIVLVISIVILVILKTLGIDQPSSEDRVTFSFDPNRSKWEIEYLGLLDNNNAVRIPSEPLDFRDANFWDDLDRPDPNAISEDYVRLLAESGRVCEIYGHHYEGVYFGTDFKDSIPCALCSYPRYYKIEVWKENAQ